MSLLFLQKIPNIDNYSYCDEETKPNLKSIFTICGNSTGLQTLKLIAHSKGITYTQLLNHVCSESQKPRNKQSGFFAHYIRGLKNNLLIYSNNNEYFLTHRGKLFMKGLRIIEQSFNLRILDFREKKCQS